MVTAGGHHELDPLIHQTVQGIAGTGGDLVLPVEQGAIEIGYNDLIHHHLGVTNESGSSVQQPLPRPHLFRDTKNNQPLVACEEG